MIEPLSLFANPFAYFLFNFISIAMTLNIVSLFTISVLISVLAYPFLLLGLKINEKTKGKNKQNKIQTLKTVFITVLVFWIVSRITYALNGHPFINAGLLSIIWALIVLTVLAFIFTAIGMKISAKIKEKYSIPHYLHLYVICLITSFIFTLSMVLLMMIVYYNEVFGGA